jgi:hypothetical protein
MNRLAKFEHPARQTYDTIGIARRRVVVGQFESLAHAEQRP